MITETELRRCLEKVDGRVFEAGGDYGGREYVRISMEALTEFANDLTSRTDVSLCWVPGSFSNRCCCNCRYRLNDRSHPSTDGGRVTEDRGYVCVNPELVGEDGRYSHSGWSAHGLCEVHEFKKNSDRPL